MGGKADLALVRIGHRRHRAN